jgi:hypothetical protein
MWGEAMRRGNKFQWVLILLMLLGIGAGSAGACFILDESRNAKGVIKGRCDNNDKPISCKKVNRYKRKPDDVWVCKGPRGTKASWSLSIAVDQACGCRK